MYQMLKNLYSDACVPHATALLWYGKFQDDLENIQGELRMECHRTSQTYEKTDVVCVALEAESTADH